MYTIPIYKLEFQDSFIFDFQRGVREILTSDSISESKYVKKFETEFGKLTNSEHCIAVTSGTAALEIALRTIDVRGKKVIVPSNTFFATTVAITNAGGIIELIDIESEYMAICPKSLKEKISEGVGAVILVHIGGIISHNYKEIREICRQFNVPLIEDAAHSHGSTVEGKYAGTIGDIGCFSFFPTKVMTTGEGGMVTTNNPNYYDKIRSLKNFGRDNNNSAICVNSQGANYKISEFTGLMGYLECGRVKRRVAKRNELLNRYIQNLEGSSYVLVTQKSGYCSYYKCILKISIDREWLRQYCKEKNITLTGEVYKIPIHQQPLYKEQFEGLELPVTNDICKNHICPPLYPELLLEEIDYVSEVLLNAEKEFM